MSLHYLVTMRVCAELPKLVEAPSVDNITCSQLDVVWSAWSASSDIGTDTLDIVSYTLVSRRNLLSPYRQSRTFKNWILGFQLSPVSLLYFFPPIFSRLY